MENRDNKIVIGDVELWTAHFGKDKATITAREEGTKLWLYHMHKKMPDLFEIYQDDEDFCEEDLEGAFTVIVNPEKVEILITPGNIRIGFRCVVPDQQDEVPEMEVVDHEDGEVI